MGLDKILAKAEKPVKVVVDVMKASGDPKLSTKEATAFAYIKDAIEKYDEVALVRKELDKASRVAPAAIVPAVNEAANMIDCSRSLQDALSDLADAVSDPKKMRNAPKLYAEVEKKHQEALSTFKACDKRVKRAVGARKRTQELTNLIHTEGPKGNLAGASAKAHIDLFLKELADWKPKRMDMNSHKQFVASAKQAKTVLGALKKKLR